METVSCHPHFPERRTYLPKIPQLGSDYEGDSPGNDGEGSKKLYIPFRREAGQHCLSETRVEGL